MDIFLIIGAFYLLFTMFVFGRNWFEFKSLNDRHAEPSSKDDLPLVSICVPARNEEQVIEKCLTSAFHQNYPNLEVLLLDDNSTDNTKDIAESFCENHSNLHLISGETKPKDWLGKPWACHQLSQHARGEILIFIDADVWIDRGFTSKAVKALEESSAITVWPKQHVKTFWEKLIIPMIYYGLYSLLPAKYVEQNPKWLPPSLRKKFAPAFAAACGQCIAFNREIYDAIGGHTSVKDEIVEDVELAKVIKKQGFSITMYDGIETVNCRMYQNHHEIFEGLRKNFFVGFGRNLPLFLFMAAMQFIVYVIPFWVLTFGSPLQKVIAGTLVLLFLIQRWLLDLRFKWNPLFSLLQPFTILWYEVLGARCIWDHYTGKKASWKGRDV